MIGAISLMGLFVKRVLEKPKRRFVVFIADISKQIVNSLLLHFFNLSISIALSDNPDSN